MATKRKNIRTWQRVEFIKLLKRTEKCCVFCNTPWSANVRPTLDHIVPVSAGGDNGLKNLTLACEPCNNLRGSIPFLIFMENVTSPESRETYRNELAREGKNDELYIMRQQRNKEKREYIRHLRNLYDKDSLEVFCNDLHKKYRSARRMGDVAKALDFKAKLISHREELSLVGKLIDIRVKNKFCGRKFK